MTRTWMTCSVVLLAVAPGAAFAGDDLAAAVQRCAGIEDDAERLACFDRLGDRGDAAGADAATEAVEGTGRWEVRVSEDSLGRGESVSLILGADEIKSNYGLPVFLVLRCVQGRPELFIDWGVTLGNDAFIESTFGDGASEIEVWDLAASGDSSFYPSRNPDAFVRRLAGAERYVASTEVRGGESRITARFRPAGLDRALARMEQGCGWSPSAAVADQDTASGPELSGQDRKYRDQALANFHERCGVDPDGKAAQKALADFDNLMGLGYTPKRIWQLSRKISEGCRVQSFRDEIIARGDP